MRGKYKRKKQRQKAPPNPGVPSVSPGVNQEPTAKKERTNERQDKKEPSMKVFINHLRSPKFVLELIAVVVGLGVLVVYYCQLRVMRQQVNLAERAWVGFVLPTNLPLNGTSIPATIQVNSFGKTPARGVEGDIIATIFNKGQEPDFDYGDGHPHHHFRAGAIFPNDPIPPLSIPVVRYTPFPPWETVLPADAQKELDSGRFYITFYGRITYTDIFDKEHWTHFCTGYGTAMLSDINVTKKCIAYNDVDHDE